MDRGLLDAAEFNNASSDKALGFADVSKICMLQSYHQNAETFEILFNKDKFNALPDRLRATIENAVEASSQDMIWKAIARYSEDYLDLQSRRNVKFYKTPDALLKRQLEVYDEIIKKKAPGNPLFREVLDFTEEFCAAHHPLGTGHCGQPTHGLRSLLRVKRCSQGYLKCSRVRVFPHASALCSQLRASTRSYGSIKDPVVDRCARPVFRTSCGRITSRPALSSRLHDRRAGAGDGTRPADRRRND